MWSINSDLMIKTVFFKHCFFSLGVLTDPKDFSPRKKKAQM